MDTKKYFEHTLPKVSPYLNVKMAMAVNRWLGYGVAPKGWARFYRVFGAFSFSFSLGIVMVTQTANVIAVWGDVEKMPSGLFVFMTDLLHFVKLLNILHKRHRVQTLQDCLGTGRFDEGTRKYERLVSRFTWIGMMHYAIILMLGVSCVFALSVMVLYHYLNDEMVMLIDAWYPYDYTKSPAMEITNIHLIIAMLLCATHNLTIDSITAGYMSVVCCQFEILKLEIVSIGENLKKLAVSDEEFRSVFEKKETELYERLMKCIEHHLEIIRYAREIESIFSFTIFLQFIESALVLCMTALKISQTQDNLIVDLFGTFLYLLCMMYQLFMYCWYGNEILLQSESIVLAAYSGNWWKSTERYKRALLLIMVRAKQPLIMTAGNFMTLSLNTFVGILRASYSFYTVLRSTRDKTK